MNCLVRGLAPFQACIAHFPIQFPNTQILWNLRTKILSQLISKASQMSVLAFNALCQLVLILDFLARSGVMVPLVLIGKSCVTSSGQGVSFQTQALNCWWKTFWCYFALLESMVEFGVPALSESSPEQGLGTKPQHDKQCEWNINLPCYKLLRFNASFLLVVFS